MELWQLILTSGVAVAVIKFVESALMWRLNRGAEASKEARINLTTMAATDKALEEAMRVILHDRLKYLGRSYIRAGEIAFDDREDLVGMHNVYHNLGGNGNMDHLMAEVARLPLKKQ